MSLFIFYILFFHLYKISLANVNADYFCNLIENDLCIRNQPLIIYYGSLTVLLSNNILIKNTKLICNNAQSCSISIKTNQSLTIFNSSIYAPFINISSQNLIVNISEISSNGTIGKNLGTSFNPNQGNAFMGIGAYCQTDNNGLDLTYGRICEDVIYNTSMNLSGSGGEYSNLFGKLLIFNFFLLKSRNEGGGFLNLSAEVITLFGSSLSSSGFPLSTEKNIKNCQYISAGSGGTIAIIGAVFNLSENSFIRAEGGWFCGSKL